MSAFGGKADIATKLLTKDGMADRGEYRQAAVAVKRTRLEPRQYNLVDLERARDRVEAAYRRIENDRTNNPSRARAGLERARLDLYAIESDLRRRSIIE